ncbi:hypothetical protein SAM40697_0280 [Streptomyces ambofaciens]|uniref:Uncharacterized protein n=1 Tax=Streptomyces ambofaciens TaxID=1889 RepID=A0ABN4P2E3_STRAM|nr:hypothetical protein SAM40697_0280 [Streptomyces ambofaciens]
MAPTGLLASASSLCVRCQFRGRPAPAGPCLGLSDTIVHRLQHRLSGAVQEVDAVRDVMRTFVARY